MRDVKANAKAIFLEALEQKGSEELPRFLDEACGGDAGLRSRVEELLRAHYEAGSFLEPPALSSIATGDAALVTERPGTVIGPYKLLQQIGEGGMGVVFMAEQTQPVQRKVALKVIKPGMDSRQVVARFEAERQALALMDHVSIARVYDGGATEKDRPYFVMELVHGVPITQYCDDHRLTLRQRLELFVPVCQAIQHAHQKGIIHRDIKPSNVMVTLYDGRPVPKVIDFGVAKATEQKLTERTLFTQYSTMVGTLEYMSPEQAELSALGTDTRSDIYSLGVLLYELLTGSTPLTHKRMKEAAFAEILRLIKEEEPQKPSTRLSDSSETLASISANRQTEPTKLTKLVKGDLDWIVMKALEKARERRYETANGFAADVQRYLADEPVLACPPSAGYRIKKFVRRNKGPVIAGGVVLLCLMAGVVGTSAGLVWALGERDKKAAALIAETNAREAEKQARDRAMTALRALTDDFVESQMARGTQLTEENREFLRKIITHFDGFAAVTADDAESRAVRAEGHFRVGIMRYRLGELRDAEAALAEALALRKQLAADFPARAEFRHELARSHRNLALLFRDTSRPKDAEAAFADSLALQKQLAADFPNWPEYRTRLAGTYNNLGNLLRGAAGRLQDAEAAYAEAVTLLKQLAADFPDRPEYRQDLAASYNNLGALLDTTGRPKAAEAAFADALALYKQMTADFPNRPELRSQLAASHNNLGILFYTAGRPKEAETAYTAALALQKQLAADFPNRPEYRSRLAGTYNNLSDLLQLMGRLEGAEAALANALALYKQLAADFPNRPEYRSRLAVSIHSLGTLLHVMGRPKEGEAALAEALALQKQLVADLPNDPNLQRGVAATCLDLAQMRLGQRDFETSKAYLSAAEPHHVAALRANPRHLDYQRIYRAHLTALTQTHAGLGDPAGANQAAEKLRDLGWNPPGDAYEAARSLALCIPIVRKDDQATEETRARQVAFYGDEALKMLRGAVTKGYRDAASMNKDSDLAPLRGRDDFKQLLAELKAMKK